MLKTGADAGVAFLVGFAGGALFYLLGAPLPWTLGSLSAAALVATSGGRRLMPNPVRDVARPVVGILAGSAFTPEVVASIGEWWGAVVFVALYALIASILGWIFFRKLCRLDPVTSYFASTPGGLGELTLLGGAYGGSMRTLVTIHSVRVVAVVFTVPFFLQLVLGAELQRTALPGADAADAAVHDWLILTACGLAGYALAKLLKFPGGSMILPLLFSAAVHGTGLTHVLPPSWLVAIVQVVIGSVAGARFAGIRWHELRNTLLQAVLWVCVLLSTAVAFAVVGMEIFDRPFAALVLAAAPGGLVEMTIVSYALGIETAFVVTCQVCRSVFVLTFAPVFFRLLGVRKPQPSALPPSGAGRAKPGEADD